MILSKYWKLFLKKRDKKKLYIYIYITDKREIKAYVSVIEY